jgi:Sulfotransferase domain
MIQRHCICCEKMHLNVVKGNWKNQSFQSRRHSDCVKLTSFCCIVILLLVIAYIVSVHRIRTITDLMIISNTMNMPMHDHRCRSVNASSYVCLPNIFLIGASKCGTTSLMDYLTQHPMIAHVRRRIQKIDEHREVHRFDRKNYGWASRTIEQADEWASSPVVSDPRTAVIHYTPHYLYAPSVPYEMRLFYPKPDDLKFIVVLREPVERALSSYWFRNSHIFYGQDRGTIDEFILLANGEIESRKQYDDCMLKREGFVIDSGLNDITDARKSEARKNNLRALKFCFGSFYRDKVLGSRHVDKGIYYDQIQRWYDNFPKRNFYFLLLSKFQKDPAVEYAKLLGFIFHDTSDADGEKASDQPNFFSDLDSSSLLRASINSTLFIRRRLVKPNSLSSVNSLPILFAEKLGHFYRPYNERLFNLTGATSY